MERIAAGWYLAEAPVAAPGGRLFFSDALGGGVYRWSPDTAEVETVLPTRRGIGGMALHADGGLVVSGRDISRLTPAGETTPLYSDDSATGFNDLTVDAAGRIVAGVLRFRPFAGEDAVPGEFIRIEPGNGTTTAIAGVDWVNGCAFSPDGHTFYGCDYHRGLVLAADAHEDGTFGEPRAVVVSPSGEADGMAVDEDGALWVALGAGGSVGRFRPDGELDLTLEVPAPFVASLCFGGSDRRDLFITTAGNPDDPDAPGGLYLTRSDTPGLEVPAAV
jgi:sugar lactone lactonase YvrE